MKQERIAAYEFVYLAASTGNDRGQARKASLEKELTPKELEKGRAKATQWSSQHHPPLVLRGKTRS